MGAEAPAVLGEGQYLGTAAAELGSETLGLLHRGIATKRLPLGPALLT